MNFPSPPCQVPRLPPRQAESHKGDYGHVLILGGSRSMPGAAALAGMAALRGGAGLVRLAVPKGIQPIVAGFHPCYMTLPLPEDAAGRLDVEHDASLAELVAWADVVACGPGLDRSQRLDALVASIYTSVQKPVVLDADALNALASRPGTLAKKGGPRILTPHPGEFARLLGHLPSSRSEAEQAASEMASRHGLLLILKGHATFITDGTRQFTNPTGNPGMATGGTGDVLTGLVAALWAGRRPPFDAACMATFAHGRAGDAAAATLGQTALLATDLLDFLPQALRELEAGE